jgi:RimJ/RimL family protein N-acetyltransferase
MASALLSLDLRVDQAISEVTLATPRLSLRPLRQTDVTLLRQGQGTSGASLAEEALAEFCSASEAEWHLSGMGYFLVFRTGEPLPIGLVRLVALASVVSGRTAELNYAINAAFQNQGYGTEAVGAVLGFAFDEARLDFVVACVEPDNIPSLKVAERNGLVAVGEGRVHDRLMRRFLISAATWNGRRRFSPAPSRPAGPFFEPQRI